MYFRASVCPDNKRWIPLSQLNKFNSISPSVQMKMMYMHAYWLDGSFLHPFENRNGTKRDGMVSFCIKSGKGRRKVVSVVGTHCKLKWENLISNWHIKCVQFNFTPKTICATIIMPAIQYRPLSALTLHCRRSHLIRHTQRQSPQSLP